MGELGHGQSGCYKQGRDPVGEDDARGNDGERQPEESRQVGPGGGTPGRLERTDHGHGSGPESSNTV